MSICRAHHQRVTAARESAAAASGADSAMTGGLYDRMLGQLSMHRAQLKSIQSRTAKIDAKRGLLPDYDAYVDGVLAGGGGAQDDVLATIMVWRLDVGDWSGALDIAAYGVRHGFSMPEPFSRDFQTTLVEELATAALQSDPVDSTLADPIAAALDLTADLDMVDEVRAKAHKALGLIALESDPAASVSHLDAALRLDPKCGVKTLLARARKSVPDAGQ